MTFYVLTQYLLYMDNTITLWEEKNLIEQSRKSESKLTFAPNDGINAINNISVKTECSDTGKIKRFRKSCPDCGKEQYFYTEQGLKYSLTHNTRCPICKNRTKRNYVGMKFGKLTVVKQYYINGQGDLRVDYICDCGRIKHNIQSSKMHLLKMCCVCKKKNEYKILPYGETAFNNHYSSYSRAAKRRQIPFELTKDEFRTIIKQNCYYCGQVPSMIKRPNSSGGACICNGIDRMDSNGGYTISNCVPCCSMCNYAKLDSSVSDFLSHVKKIYEYQIFKTQSS